MSMTVVGNCHMCGAPIYQPSVWMGIIPPPRTYSCSCLSEYNAKIYVSETIIPNPEKPKIPELKLPTRAQLIEVLKHYRKGLNSKSEIAAFEAVIEWIEANT